MKTVAFLLVLTAASCAYSTPRTLPDMVWYAGFLQAQEIGGSCTDQTCRYRDYLHDVLRIPYERMRLVSSVIDHSLDPLAPGLWDYEPAAKHRLRVLHLRLQVYMPKAGAWRTFDPTLDAFNYDEGFGHYWLHKTRAEFAGDYRPVEPAGIYAKTELPPGGKLAD